jgi:hypothetical protein
MPSDKLYSIPERLSNNKPFINSIEEYESRWKESENNPCRFFGKVNDAWFDNIISCN